MRMLEFMAAYRVGALLGGYRGMRTTLNTTSGILLAGGMQLLADLDGEHHGWHSKYTIAILLIAAAVLMTYVAWINEEFCDHLVRKGKADETITERAAHFADWRGRSHLGYAGGLMALIGMAALGVALF